MNSHYYALLLSGGSGTRFWPLSRSATPKQFLPLLNTGSLFEATLARVKPMFAAQNVFVATHRSYRSLVFKYIAKFHIPSSNVICETVSKNTAPSIAAAVHIIHRKDPQAKVCVLPCDHFIKNEALFRKMLLRALDLCDKSLVIFGIPPVMPSTGYGYIKVHSTLSGGSVSRFLREKGKKAKGKSDGIYRVERFFEKPDVKTAKRFCADGRYFWNSGMCVGSSSLLLQEIQEFLPDCFNQLQKIKSVRELSSFWGRCKAISFDFAVLEKVQGLTMLAAHGLGWSDMGSWFSYDEQLHKDAHGNMFKGSVVNRGSSNTTVLGKKRLIACIGLKDTIIIDTDDALLISKKDMTEEVKNIVIALKKKKRKEV